MRLRIPATTANMGPGFDCIGMALALYNYIEFEPLPEERQLILTAEGEGSEEVSLTDDNLIYQVYVKTLQSAGEPIYGIKMHFENHIPFSRGLGSSSAAIIGGAMVANTLMKHKLSNDELLKIALTFEGHPDNIAPALLGGIVLSGVADEGIFTRKILPPENLHCTVLIPDYPLATAKAREVLPQNLSMADAVFNIGRMGLLINALHTGNIDDLALAMQDRLHQPYRRELICAMPEIEQTAQVIGAKSVVISGAGPTLLIISDKIVDFSALVNILNEKGASGKVLDLSPVAGGAVLV